YGSQGVRRIQTPRTGIIPENDEERRDAIPRTDISHRLDSYFAHDRILVGKRFDQKRNRFLCAGTDMAQGYDGELPGVDSRREEMNRVASVFDRFDEIGNRRARLGTDTGKAHGTIQPHSRIAV